MKKKSKIAITIAAIAAMVSIISKDKKTKEVCKCEDEESNEGAVALAVKNR